jgi:hypothetical protein
MQLTTTPQAQAAKPIHAGVGLLLGLFSRLNLFALLPGNRFLRPDFLEAEEPGKVGVQGAEGVQFHRKSTGEASKPKRKGLLIACPVLQGDAPKDRCPPEKGS